MGPIYLVIAIDANGSVRCAQTTEPYIPAEFVQPGEIGFLIQPMEVFARHAHGIVQ